MLVGCTVQALHNTSDDVRIKDIMILLLAKKNYFHLARREILVIHLTRNVPAWV